MMKKAGAFLLLAASAWALGIFFFDLGLVVLRRFGPDGGTIMTNSSGWGPCFLSASAALAVLILLSLAGGFFQARRRKRSMGEGFVGQAWTFAPVLALAFARFAEGRAVPFIVPIPLFPLLLAAVFISILCLNARFHRSSARPRRALFPPGVERKKTGAIIQGVVLVAILTHLLTLNPFFTRYSSYMIFAGDEPKYVRMASSLAEDGDLDLTNNFTGNDLEVAEQIRSARAAGTRAVGDYTIIGRDGGLYHFHMPGISALILPAYLIDLKIHPRTIPNTQPLMFLPARMTVTRAWLMVLAVVFFLLLARFYHHLFRSRFLALFLLLALVAATRIPEFLLQVYPETAAGICLFLGLNALFFPFARAWTNRAALVAGIGLLPWFHQRFIPIALSLYVLFLIHNRKAGRRGREFAAVSLPLAVIGLGYAAYFYLITGNPMPWSMYSLWGTSYTRAAIFPSGFFGYLFDTSSGLLAMFPVLLFALTGVYWGLKKERRTAGKLLAVILPYFALICITPWHGLAWETTRMSLVLIPLFLVFAGFTLRALADETSIAHLLFYGAGLSFLLLNKGGKIWKISLGNILVQPHQVGEIVQSAVVLVLFFGLLWVLDRWTPNTLRPLPFPVWGRKIRTAARTLQRTTALPLLKKGIVGLCLAVPFLYGLIYINNWNDKTLAPSYFPSLAKIGRISDLRLVSRTAGKPSWSKSEEGFGSLFPGDIPFELFPGQTRKSLSFGPGGFLEKCPAGRYWLSVEFADAPADLTALFLDFAGETWKLILEPGAGTKSAAVTHLLFKDLYLAPEAVLRFSDPVSGRVRGKLHFAPIPSYVFDGRLILMPGDDHSPRPIRSIGPRLFLTLTAITGVPGLEASFDVSVIDPAAGEGESRKPFRSFPLDLGKTVGRRFNFPLDIDGTLPPAGASLALAVVDEKGRRFRAKSVAFPSGDLLDLGTMPDFRGGRASAISKAVPRPADETDRVSFDRIRVEFSTAADWARLEWLNQADVLATRVISVPEEASASWSATADYLGLGQPAEQVQAARRIALVADYAVTSEARTRPFEFLLQKGSANKSRLRVSLVGASGEKLLDEIEYGAVEEDRSGLNSLFVSIDPGLIRNAPFSRASLRPGEGKPVRWEFLEDLPLTAEEARLRIQEARALGISGFFLPWPGSGKDRILEAIFESAAGEDFRLSFSFSPAGAPGEPPPDEVRMAAAVALAVERFGRRPSFLQADGRPALAVPVAGTFTREAWSRIFAELSGRGLEAAALAAGLEKTDFERFIDLDEGRPFLDPGPENPGPVFVRDAGYFSLLRDERHPQVWITAVPPLFKRIGDDYRLVWDLRY